MKKYLEIEYKYSADAVSLKEFRTFCEERKPIKYIEASGYDYFYSDPSDVTFFGRFRDGHDMKQLTVKRKTVNGNNYIRDEINLNLTKNETKETMDAWFDFFGYKKAASLFKACFVYKYEWYTFVYYVCYNEEMKELGRFIEIEMDENKEWGPGEAESNLTMLEKLCKPLGIIPQARVKRSLFEMFGQK